MQVLIKSFQTQHPHIHHAPSAWDLYQHALDPRHKGELDHVLKELTSTHPWPLSLNHPQHATIVYQRLVAKGYGEQCEEQLLQGWRNVSKSPPSKLLAFVESFVWHWERPDKIYQWLKKENETLNEWNRWWVWMAEKGEILSRECLCWGWETAMIRVTNVQVWQAWIGRSRPILQAGIVEHACDLLVLLKKREDWPSVLALIQEFFRNKASFMSADRWKRWLDKNCFKEEQRICTLLVLESILSLVPEIIDWLSEDKCQELIEMLEFECKAIQGIGLSILGQIVGKRSCLESHSDWLRGLRNTELNPKAMKVWMQLKKTEKEQEWKEWLTPLFTTELPIDQVIEALLYATRYTWIKEAVVEEEHLLLKLIKGTKGGPDAFGLAIVLLQLTMYPPLMGKEDKQLAQLAKMAKQPGVDVESRNVVTNRVKVLLKMGYLSTVFSWTKQPLPENVKSVIVQIVGAAVEDHDHRSIVVTQIKPSFLIKYSQSSGDKQSIQTLARIAISLNPSIVFTSSQRIEIVPLFIDLIQQEENQLFVYEGLLALTNLVSSAEEPLVARAFKGLGLFEYHQLSTHPEIQCAATEVICNMSMHSAVISHYSTSEKLKLLVVLLDSDNSRTRLAAGGALAMMVSVSDAIAPLLVKIKSFSECILALFNNEGVKDLDYQHRALVLMAACCVFVDASVREEWKKIVKSEEFPVELAELVDHINKS